MEGPVTLTREMREMTLADRQRMGERRTIFGCKRLTEAQDRIPLRHAFQYASGLKHEGWLARDVPAISSGSGESAGSKNLFASAGGGVKTELTRITTLLQRWDDRLVVPGGRAAATETHGPRCSSILRIQFHKEWRNLLTE